MIPRSGKIRFDRQTTLSAVIVLLLLLPAPIVQPAALDTQNRP